MRYIVIGSGNISNTYINAIAELESSSVVGCISRRGMSPQAAPQLPNWKSLSEVDIDYDAVVVATPNGEHHKGIIAAAENGKHAITEKPLDISIPAMTKAVTACKNAGVTLAVAYQRRVAPDNLAIKKLLDQEAFGRVFAVDVVAKFYRPQAYYDSGDYRGGFEIDGGGPFMQQASHNLDLYTWFFGLPEKYASMMDTFNHKIEAEDHGAAIMCHANGMIGTVVASTIAKPGYAAKMEVHTQKGSFILTDDVVSDWQIDDVPNPTDTAYDYQHDGAVSAAVTDTTGHQTILRDFENAAQNGTEPFASGASAQKTTELILAIYDAKIH